MAPCAPWSAAAIMPTASTTARSPRSASRARRSSRSSISTAIEAGLTPETIRQDAPLDVKGWKPENYTHEYFGAVTLTQALAMSLNTVAVRLGLEVGAKERGAHRASARHFLEARRQCVDRARHLGSLAHRTGRRLCAVRQWRPGRHPACRDQDPHHRGQGAVRAARRPARPGDRTAPCRDDEHA